MTAYFFLLTCDVAGNDSSFFIWVLTTFFLPLHRHYDDQLLRATAPFEDVFHPNPYRNIRIAVLGQTRGVSAPASCL